MALQSKTKLFEILRVETEDEEFRKGLSHPSIGNETYGRKSMVYVHWNLIPGFDRKSGEETLEAYGCNVNRRYWPGHEVSEVQVSYFKGHHWQE